MLFQTIVGGVSKQLKTQLFLIHERENPGEPFIENIIHSILSDMTPQFFQDNLPYHDEFIRMLTTYVFALNKLKL